VLYCTQMRASSRPTQKIARNALTNLLIQNIPSDVIKRNHKISNVRSNRNATTGATEGTWSQVRKLLSEVQPFYSGAPHVTVTVRNVSTKYPYVIELSGSSTLCGFGGGNTIMTQRGP
jgi:hypothetical protein